MCYFKVEIIISYSNSNHVKLFDIRNALQKGMLYKHSQTLMNVWQICRKYLHCSHGFI